jgi:long-chain acyl-CoA synthetase
MITDRKKDLIVTANGKNVAPAHFQNLVRARSPFVAHAVVHGDRRNFCVALIALHEDEVRRWARSEALETKSYSDLVQLPEVRALVQQAVDDVNRQLPAYEQVRKFALLPVPLTIENGMLTSSLKVKRRVVEARYQQILDGFYEGALETL